MHVSSGKHLPVKSTAPLTSSGFGSTEVIVTAGSGDMSDLNFSEESVNAGGTNGSPETGVPLVPFTSPADRDASTPTGSEAVGASLSANCALAANDARRSAAGPASVLSITKERNTTIHARARAGMASARHNVLIANNRGFMVI